MNQHIKRWGTIFLFTSAAVSLGWWVITQLNRDLWYDEIYSLRFFAFRDWSTTITDYHLPNNHVLFNLIIQIVGRISGLHNITSAAEHVYLFRSIQLLVSLFTVWYGYKISRKILPAFYAAWFPVLLITSIPFLNFSLQLRGYCESMLFCMMMIYYCWSFAEKETRGNRNGLIFSVFALIYTIPSNIYVATTMLMILLLRYWQNRQSNEAGTYWRAIKFLLTGILLAILCYLHVLHQVISTPYSSAPTTDVWHSIKLLRDSTIYFLSGRIFILLPVLAGLFLFIKNASSEKNRMLYETVLLLVVPFLLAFIHQKNPFDRTFVLLAPVFALLLVIGTAHFHQLLQQHLAISILFTITVSSYCLFTLWQELRVNNTEAIRMQEENNRQLQTMYGNYFLASTFQPGQTAEIFHHQHGSKNHPVLTFNFPDKYAAELYLEKNKTVFSYCETNAELQQTLDSLQPDTFYVACTFRKQTISDVRNLTPYTAVALDEKEQFLNFLLCTRKTNPRAGINR